MKMKRLNFNHYPHLHNVHGHLLTEQIEYYKEQGFENNRFYIPTFRIGFYIPTFRIGFR